VLEEEQGDPPEGEKRDRHLKKDGPAAFFLGKGRNQMREKKGAIFHSERRGKHGRREGKKTFIQQRIKEGRVLTSLFEGGKPHQTPRSERVQKKSGKKGR